MYKTKKEQYDEIVAQIKDIKEKISQGQSMLDRETDITLKSILQASLTNTIQKVKDLKKRLREFDFLKKI